MSPEDFQKHVLEELKDIKATQIAHREDYIREVTRINAERKTEARITGGIWGMIAAAITIIFRWAWDQLSR